MDVGLLGHASGMKTPSNLRFGTFSMLGAVSIGVLLGVWGCYLQSSASTSAFFADLPARIGRDVLRENEVQTSLGVIAGQVFDDSKQYLGIPYAKPPVGSLRFRPSLLWDYIFDGGRLNADHFGPICPQGKIMFGLPTDEDCLTLNVYTPRKPIDIGFPVMVFLHGGGFGYGASHYRGNDYQDYNGTHLASRYGAVVVTVNYRLGLLGWLSLPDQVQKYGYTGNYGIWDAITALKWVRLYISAFGGDPGRTHLFGQSAGAIITCALLTAPAARHLFHSAAIQSGHCEALPLPLALEQGVTVGAHFGCKEPTNLTTCLQKLSWQSILEAQLSLAGGGTLSTGLVIFPVQDQLLLKDHPFTLVRKGQMQPDVPVMMGQNYDAGTWFTQKWLGGPWEYGPNRPVRMSRDVFITEVSGYLQKTAMFWPCLGGKNVLDQVLKMYPPSTTEDNAMLYATFFGDARYICPCHNFVKHASQVTSTYVYSFRHRCYPGVKPEDWGVYHGSELHYVFGEPSPNCTYDKVEQSVVEMVSSLWFQFASTHTTPPMWPKYNMNLSIREVLTISKDGFGLSDSYRRQECDFWHRITHECHK